MFRMFIDCADRFAGQGKQENHEEMEKSGLDNLERPLENGQ